MSTPPSPRRTTLQQHVVAAILDSAAGVLASRGGHANMTDVSHAAGLARATVYRYFPSRQALLDALVQVARGDASERLEAAGLDDVPVEEGMRRAVRALIDVGDPFVVLAQERAATEPAEFEERVAEPLQRLFARGQADGRIRRDVPTSWLVESLVGLVVSIPSTPPGRGREDTIAAITSLFLDGARGSSPGA